MANLFPQYLSDYVTEKLRDAGVNVLTGRMVKEITSVEGKVNIKLDNDATVAADHLGTRKRHSACLSFFSLLFLTCFLFVTVLATGVIPDTRVASFCELEIDPVNRGIVANSELQVRSDLWVV